MNQTTLTNNVALKSIHSGNGDGVHLELMMNDKRIYVSFLPSRVEPPNAIDDFIARYDMTSEEGNYTAEEDLLEEMQDLIFESGGGVLERIAPPSPETEEMNEKSDIKVDTVETDGTKGKKLSEVLFPETFSFQMEIVNGKVQLDKEDKPCPFITGRVELKVTIRDGELEVFSVEDLIFERQLGKWGKDGWVSLVKVPDGRELCFKGEQFDTRALEREMACLMKVAAESPKLRVPRIIGLVEKVERGVFGVLMDFVRMGDGEDSLEDIIKRGENSQERKKKWFRQIRETVEGLHRIGVVWGDAKPGNILVEAQSDDIWVIDFGGLYTDGWVDAGLMETVEGDQQALGRISKFLGVE